MHKSQNGEAESRDVWYRGGDIRSSDESAVMAVEIPKKSGGTRRLGIPTIADRTAQMVVKMYIEPSVEPIFHKDSYGYRQVFILRISYFT